LKFIDQTLGSKFAVQSWVITGHPLLKTLSAVSDLIFLTRDHPFSIRMGSAGRHNNNVLYHTFQNKEKRFVESFEKGLILFKIKEDENFYQRNTFSISRIKI